MHDRRFDWPRPLEGITLPTFTRRELIVSAISTAALPLIGKPRIAAAQRSPEVRKPKDPNEQPPLEFRARTDLGERFVRHNVSRQSGELVVSFNDSLIKEVFDRMTSEQTDRASIQDDFNLPDINFRIISMMVSQRFKDLGTFFQISLGVGTPENAFGVARTRPVPEGLMAETGFLVATWDLEYLTGVDFLNRRLENIGINTTIYNSKKPGSELLP